MKPVSEFASDDFLNFRDIDAWKPAQQLHTASSLTPYLVGHHPAQTMPIFHHLDTDADSMALPALVAAHLPMTAPATAPADTSPSMATEVAFINGIDSGGLTVATSFWTWNNDTPATYATRSNDHKWGGTSAGTAAGTINYYFDTASSWTATEEAQMTACLTLWSDIANIHFNLVSSSASAQITFHRGNDGQAVTPAGWSGSGSSGVVGGSTLWTLTNATIDIDNSVPGFGPMDGNFQSIGGYVWMTIEHEAGHAIGLGHGGAYNGSVDSATQQYSAYDSRLWTIMSYIDADDSSAKYFAQYPVTGTSWGTAGDGYAYVPTTPMILDDLAIQELYGASTSAAYAGGQIFGFHCNITDATEQFYDFTKNTNPVVTIWDAGDNNKLDLSGYNAPSTINLNPGTFSSAHGMVNNIGIAFGAKIDSAVGGLGADTFYANADVDHLQGNGGNDNFYFGATLTAADTIDGGAGTNNVYLDGDYSAGLVMTGATMINVLNVILSPGHSYNITPTDKQVAAGKFTTLDAHALGTGDTLTFNAFKELDGSWHVRGGMGNDTIVGGSGNDVLVGGVGIDHLKGGPGADTFTYTWYKESTSGGHDVIVDFDATQDKIDLWFTVSGLKAPVTHGAASPGTGFDAQIASAVGALSSHQAVLFTADSGTFSGHTFLVVDVNGVSGYQGNADLIIDLEHITGTFTTANLI